MLTSKEKKNVEESLNNPSGGYTLILHNDDVNTFEHVINQLMNYCNHTAEQAEQCALITHLKGKCDILVGDKLKLEAIKQQLHDQKLSATIDIG